MYLELMEKALEEKNRQIFKKIPKTDLHTHALLSSNRNVFKSFYPQKRLKPFKENSNINSLSEYIKNNIIDISTTKKGQLNLFEATIQTAINDGITILDTSVDYRLVYEIYNNDCNMYIKDLKRLKNKYCNKIVINYDLGISRNNYKKEHKKIIKELISSNFFNGIDLYGDELSAPINSFTNIYKFARKNGLILKAHVGEFGTAKDIYMAIKKLKLQVVQHGISIVDNTKIMNFAKKKNIIFTVCPISNLKLKRVSTITEHPIKKMFDYGLKVTINTDDQLIFQNSLFDEYLLLYQNKVFSAEQLNTIRENGMKKRTK